MAQREQHAPKNHGESTRLGVLMQFCRCRAASATLLGARSNQEDALFMDDDANSDNTSAALVLIG